MYGRSDQWLGGILWGKGSSSHFGIKPDQSPGELVKVNCCQKGLDHLGLFRMPVGLLAFSGYTKLKTLASWKALGIHWNFYQVWNQGEWYLEVPLLTALLLHSKVFWWDQQGEEVLQPQCGCAIQSGHQEKVCALCVGLISVKREKPQSIPLETVSLPIHIKINK